MEKTAKKINNVLKENTTIQEYLKLKEEIESDENLIILKNKLDDLRKKICRDNSLDSEEYYLLLENYKKNPKVIKFERMTMEIKGLMVEISDILSLK